jgi:histidinol dehydrogenase
MSIPVINYRQADFAAKVAAVRDRLRGGGLTSTGQSGVDVRTAVADILADVRRRGDEALVAWEQRLDGAELVPATLRVSEQRFAEVMASADRNFLALVHRVAGNIHRYQENILLKAPASLRSGGRELAVRYTPIDRVGVYVPGWRALYPSTMLMTVVPAQVAGVKEIVIASPPGADGKINPLVVTLAWELGVKEVYRLGGAQAIAALAYGTETVRPVDKIVGPGNAFVTEAKRQVSGMVGIDSLAGPSEVLIVADDTAKPDWLAADLIAQAEHNPGSAILVTPSEKLAAAVAAAIDGQLGEASLARAAEARECLEDYGAIIVTKDLSAACEVANDFAPEHLQIITADDDAVLAKIRNAGAIFVGPYTPVPLGDYVAGPSHVLPTGGTARFFGPLSCNDFLKATNVIRYDAASLAADAADVIDFATREGLTAHAKAVKIRNPKLEIRNRKNTKKD